MASKQSNMPGLVGWPNNPSVRATRTTNQTILSGNADPIAWNNVVFDPALTYDGINGFVIPADGVYFISATLLATVPLPGITPDEYNCVISVNFAAVAASDYILTATRSLTDPYTYTIVYLAALNAGDVVRIAFNNAGAASIDIVASATFGLPQFVMFRTA